VQDKRRTLRWHGPLADLATRQHGVVSARQLRDLGYSRERVSWAARSGRLHRLYRGVYAIGHTDLDWHSHCLAAVLACAPAVASHTSAAWLWGLLRGSPSTFHLTAPTRRHSRPGWNVHYARLAEENCAEVEGIPVTSLARTLLDLAAMLPAERMERLIERSEEQKLFDLKAVDALLACAPRHRGAAPLRRALTIYRDDPAFTRSGLEKEFLRRVRAAKLPRPAMNLNVSGYELDAYWEAERFAVELDVYETHGGPAAFERDRLRQEDLKLIGVEMTRVTGKRLKREPRRVMERLARLLAQRRAELL